MTQNTYRKLKIGIDGRAFQSSIFGGVTRYAVHLCKELDEQIPNAEFFVYATTDIKFTKPSSRWTIRKPKLLLFKFLRAPLWLRYFAYSLIEKDKIDIFWGAATYLPRLHSKRKITLISTVYDLCHLYSPETMSRLHRLSHKLFFKKSVQEANFLTSISNGTASKLIINYNVGDITIVPPMLRSTIVEKFSNNKKTNKSRFLLSVGTLEPRKNITSLLSAFKILKVNARFSDLKLYIVGTVGWNSSNLYNDIMKTPDVELLGFVNDSELVQLYKSAYAFIFPSLYEGFGMPVMEAVACGAKVIASDVEEIREAGGDSPWYIQPTPNEIVRAVKMIDDYNREIYPTINSNTVNISNFVKLFRKIDNEA